MQHLVFFQSIGFFISYPIFVSILNSRLLLLIFLLNHPNKQSGANYNFVESISDIARGLLFAATFIAQSLNYKTVARFLKSNCSRVR